MIKRFCDNPKCERVIDGDEYEVVVTFIPQYDQPKLAMPKQMLCPMCMDRLEEVIRSGDYIEAVTS